jgi:hypothetical protein
VKMGPGVRHCEDGARWGGAGSSGRRGARSAGQREPRGKRCGMPGWIRRENRRRKGKERK